MMLVVKSTVPANWRVRGDRSRDATHAMGRTVKRATMVASVVVALAAAAGVAAPSANREEIRRLLYDFEVASYCGLVTDDVGEGFRRKLTALVERDRIGREEMDALRGRAWQDAHEEWQNRGLGGFRAWCRGDARRAAERLARESP